MKKYVNGAYIEMTEEEILALEEAENLEIMLQPTAEERIKALEQELMELKGVLKDDYS